jgi:S1-C subfamily serine protease
MKFPNISNVVFSIGRIENRIFRPLGTCTLLSKDSHFATAAHIINGSDKNLFIKANNFEFDQYQDTDIRKLEAFPVKVVALDPIRDTCILAVEEKVSSNLTISDTDSIVPGEAVTVLGFPHSNLGRIVLTQQTCEIGAKILLSNGGIKSKHIVLNIQTRPGQSGSPIIRNSDLSLIGILVGAYVPGNPGILLGDIDPQSLHQTTHAVSAEYLKRMI